MVLHHYYFFSWLTLIGLVQALRVPGPAGLNRLRAAQRLRYYQHARTILDFRKQEHQRSNDHLFGGLLPAATASSSSTSLHVKGGKKSGMEVGIQTAQLLMDSRRRTQLKDQMKKEYPLVPDAVLESSIDITAQAFTQVAPEKLKIALRPGGMDRVRPELEGVIVDFALSQPAIQKIPVLDSGDKRRLVELMVTVSLDFILQDAEEVLSSPEVRLEGLEEQTREVKQMMGPARLFWYRLRHNLLELGAAVALGAAGVLVYQQPSLPLVAQGLAVAKTVGVRAGGVVSIVWSKTRFLIGFAWWKAGLYFSWLQKMILQQ